MEDFKSLPPLQTRSVPNKVRAIPALRAQEIAVGQTQNLKLKTVQVG
jgi:hypothetical protein